MPKAKTTERGLGAAWRKLAAEGYELYGYRCRAPQCLHPTSREISQELPANHRWGPTMGHKNARALFGTQLPDIADIQPEHRACNSAQGSRLRAQMAAAKEKANVPRSREW